MKRTLVMLLVGLSMMVGTVGTATAAKADRVRCEIPSNYRVVCYNFTPYRVHVRLNMFTTNGVYTRYFTILRTQKVVFSPAIVNRVTWRWSF
jgi:hypothetical protein